MSAWDRPVRAVLFDFYDTLAFIDPPVIEGGRRELARQVGLTEDEFRQLWSAHREGRMLGTAGDLATQLRTMLAAAGQAPPDDLIARLVDQEYRSWERGVRLYADTLPVLRALRTGGLRLGILSNCTCQAGEVVRYHGLHELVDSVVLSFEVGLAKPDPAIYRHACAELGLPPEACGFVGDGAGGELEAAAALGLPTAKIRRPNLRRPDDPSIRADRQVGSLDELAALLGEPR